MYAKLVTTLLSTSLILTSLGGVASAATSNAGFRDLHKVTGQTEILALHDKKIVNGVSATLFAPQSPLTQAEALQLIVNGFKLDQQPQTDALIALPTLFPAVKESAWYANAFGYAYNNGVDIPHNVNPSAKVTREQYIDYVMTGLQAVGNMPAIDVVPPHIADADQLNTAYLDSVQLAIVLEIAGLDAGEKFNPAQEITRAEAAVILYQAIEYLEQSATDTSSHEPSELPVSGLYASPANGTFFSTRRVNQALTEQADQKIKVQVAVTLFEQGMPIDVESAKGAEELKRLQSLGYDIDYAQAWTYQGNLEKVQYTYLSGVFTAKQLQSFKASAQYGYAFDFASNGDGSAVQGEPNVVTGTKMPSQIAE